MVLRFVGLGLCVRFMPHSAKPREAAQKAEAYERSLTEPLSVTLQRLEQVHARETIPVCSSQVSLPVPRLRLRTTEIRPDFRRQRFELPAALREASLEAPAGTSVGDAIDVASAPRRRDALGG